MKIELEFIIPINTSLSGASRNLFFSDLDILNRITQRLLSIRVAVLSANWGAAYVPARGHPAKYTTKAFSPRLFI